MGSATDFVIKNGVLTEYTGTDNRVTIPDGVTAIGNAAFLGNTSLLSVTIPASVTAIGNRAFSECENLAEINIPESVLMIEPSAFCCCMHLAHAKYNNIPFASI